jgi:eukaryotic-like serine/threonine-protein kinase
MADCDVRSFLGGLSARIDLAWKLRSLHHVATGIHQLHSAGIAHQDVKPSNILVFDRATSKVADLGSASQRGTLSPRDDRRFAGDPSYAPPELLYGQLDPDWNNRRLGCDAYLLGSMIVFMFTGLNATSLLFSKTLPEHHPGQWKGSYTDILPHLRDAFGMALRTVQVRQEPGGPRRKRLITILAGRSPDVPTEPDVKRIYARSCGLARAAGLVTDQEADR